MVSFLPLTWFSFAQSPQTVQSAHLWDKEERVPHAALQFIYPARVLHAATRIFCYVFADYYKFTSLARWVAAMTLAYICQKKNYLLWRAERVRLICTSARVGCYVCGRR